MGADLPDSKAPVLSYKPPFSGRLAGKQVKCLREVKVLRSSEDPLLSANASLYCIYFTICKFFNMCHPAPGEFLHPQGLAQQSAVHSKG